jgi:lactoylglutathione lyase
MLGGSLERPFRVLGIQQIAIGGPSKAALRALWVDLLGLEPVGTFRSEKENVDEDILSLGAGPLRVEVDVMEPIDPARSPKVHVPPLNHLGLWIDRLAEAVDWLTARGVRFTPGGIRKGAAGHDVCFIHPKGDPETMPRGGEGVLIELVQAPLEVIAAFETLATAGRREDFLTG